MRGCRGLTKEQANDGLGLSHAAPVSAGGKPCLCPRSVPSHRCHAAPCGGRMSVLVKVSRSHTQTDGRMYSQASLHRFLSDLLICTPTIRVHPTTSLTKAADYQMQPIGHKHVSSLPI